MKIFKQLCSLALLTTLVAGPLQAQTETGWEIKATSKENYNGVTVANGRIGLVSGKGLFDVSDIVLNGVYDKIAPSEVSRVVRGPLFTNMEMAIDGKKLTDSNISNWSQTLNMKEAYIKTAFDFGSKAKVEYSIMALRNLPYMGIIVVEVTPEEDITLTTENVVIFPAELQETKSTFYPLRDAENWMPVCTSTAMSRTKMHKVATCSSFLFENESAELTTNAKGESVGFTKELKSGESFKFALIGSNCSTKNFYDPEAEAERMTVYALRSKLADIIAGHKAAWDELWQSDIIIEGNQEDQLDVRLALYNLYSFSRANTRLSIAPMGLSTATGYNGHIFWDTELWMYPPMLMLHHEIARSYIDYRTDRLEIAKQRASMFGYKGCMYPWESDDTGEEATPTWCLTGTFEHHITADIGIAFWNYYRAVGDKKWLAEEGYEVLKNIADFWASRATKNSDGSYSIINVIGSNEFAPNVDDNAFTNGSAKVALNYAIAAAKELKIKPNPAWREVADNLSFHYMPSGVMKEHAKYEGAVIKQADVNLLAYPLGLVDEEQMKRDLEYYESKIYANGPAMGKSILAVQHAMLGDRDKAYELFKSSYMPNRRPPFGVLSESANSNNPYFATGAGGLLQTVLCGFGGLRLTDKGITQEQTSLPKEWKSLTIKGVGPDKKEYKITK